MHPRLFCFYFLSFAGLSSEIFREDLAEGILHGIVSAFTLAVITILIIAILTISVLTVISLHILSTGGIFAVFWFFVKSQW